MTIAEIIKEFESYAETYLQRHTTSSKVERLHIIGNLSVWLQDALTRHDKEMANTVRDMKLPKDRDYNDGYNAALDAVCAIIRGEAQK